MQYHQNGQYHQTQAYPGQSYGTQDVSQSPQQQQQQQETGLNYPQQHPYTTGQYPQQQQQGYTSIPTSQWNEQANSNVAYHSPAHAQHQQISNTHHIGMTYPPSQQQQQSPQQQQHVYPSADNLHSMVNPHSAGGYGDSSIPNQQTIPQPSATSASYGYYPPPQQPQQQPPMTQVYQPGLHQQPQRQPQQQQQSPIGTISTASLQDNEVQLQRIRELRKQLEAEQSHENELRQQQENTWVCTLCNYRNSSDTTQCSICEKARPGYIQQQQSVNERTVTQTATTAHVAPVASNQNTNQGNSMRAPSPVDPHGWRCPHCTLVNKQGTVRCEACEKFKPECEPNTTERHAPAPAPTPAPTHQEPIMPYDSGVGSPGHAKTSSWTCVRCTFINERHMGRCEMCGNRNPNAPRDTPSRKPNKPNKAKDVSNFCAGCRRNFGILRRKHMCGRCHKVFCHECSPKRIAIKIGDYREKRVCKRCYANIMHNNSKV